jgi:chromosome segregation ATPase
MGITENDINGFKERINDIKEKISQKKARKQLLKEQMTKKYDDLKKLGINSIDDGNYRIRKLDKKCNRLMKKIENELSDLEKRIGTYNR